MSTNPSLTPAATPPPQPHTELEALKATFDAHGRKVAVVVILVAALAAGIYAYVSHGRRVMERASENLAQARSADELQAIVNEYATTPAAPLALLKLAKALYDSGNYDAALAKYTEFLARWPNHELAPGAELGKLHCMEARGQIAEAMSGFALFAQNHPQHYLTPEAVLGQARCLDELGDFVKSKEVCEDFIAANPDSRWKYRFDDVLKDLSRKMTPVALAAPEAPQPLTSTPVPVPAHASAPVP